MPLPEVDTIHLEDGVTITLAALSKRPLTPADWLAALVRAKKLKPMGLEFSHLPAGVYTALIQNGCLPLPKGTRGSPGVEGYYVPLDPDEAVLAIGEAIRGDAWQADGDDEAGAVEKGEPDILVLFQRVH